MILLCTRIIPGIHNNSHVYAIRYKLRPPLLLLLAIYISKSK